MGNIFRAQATSNIFSNVFVVIVSVDFNINGFSRSNFSIFTIYRFHPIIFSSWSNQFLTSFLVLADQQSFLHGLEGDMFFNRFLILVASAFSTKPVKNSS